jgi:hypothetical protein
MSNYSNQELRHLAENPKDDLNGVEFLRAAVNWLNYRNENLNSKKSPEQLINDFRRAVLSDEEE